MNEFVYEQKSNMFLKEFIKELDNYMGRGGVDNTCASPPPPQCQEMNSINLTLSV